MIKAFSPRPYLLKFSWTLCTASTTPLVALCRTHRSFFDVVQGNAGVLAKRRRWDVHVYGNAVGLWDADAKRTEWNWWRDLKKVKWHFKPNNLFSCLDAVTRMASFVGFHELTELHCPPDTITDRILLKALLRFVEKLHVEPKRSCKDIRFSMDPEDVSAALGYTLVQSQSA